MASTASSVTNGSTTRLLPSLAFTSALKTSLPGEQWEASSPMARQSRQVRKALWSNVHPEKSPEHLLVAVSGRAAKECLDVKTPDNAEERRVWSDYMSGNTVFPGAQPYAQAYGGTQFGVWAGQLGDGRAITIGSVRNPTTGVTWDLNLKGAGRTPYSRVFDGLAVLRSSVREFLGSELLHLMMAPMLAASGSTRHSLTSRAASLVVTRKPVYREDGVQPSAVVSRLAPGAGWIRIGTFELQIMRKETEIIKKLADFVVDEHFPHLKIVDVEKDAVILSGETEKVIPNVYGRLLREVADRNAEMVASWQAVGFTHGVVNTDNTSLEGVTIDFGPYGFLEDFDPNYISNSEDHDRRYSYANQPDAILYNLARFARCLLELVDVEAPVAWGTAQPASALESKPEEVEKAKAERLERAAKIVGAVLTSFKQDVDTKFKAFMRVKLGLPQGADVLAIMDPLLGLLRDTRADFSGFFRLLCYFYVTDPEHKPGSLKITTEDTLEKFFVESLADAKSRNPNFAAESLVNDDELRARVRSWVAQYRAVLSSDSLSADDKTRLLALRRVNPLRVPKGWVLEDICERLHKSPWTSIRWETAVTREDEEAKEEQNILLDMPDDGIIDKEGFEKAHGAQGPPTIPPEKDADFLVVERALKVFGDDMFGEVSEDGVGSEMWTEEDWKDAERWRGKAPEKRRNFACSCSS
ncbi:UPF0061-domain-containing protein [Gonapodya prolifera JEL478]|uniref:Selenoprotein O n=1 Tax=Gonapodya prolifera (strain JEL478) TaxID=1344416 RepID=A0A139AFI3_GONPJ|nr:UPF0061-domain-containing protein [Gonapodya prolifera JEL478]|eukprot:KXS15571.1 UPF0061-domain-containing protein [Gonapodya prolifera JEL478]